MRTWWVWNSNVVALMAGLVNENVIGNLSTPSHRVLQILDVVQNTRRPVRLIYLRRLPMTLAGMWHSAHHRPGPTNWIQAEVRYEI